MKFDSEKNPDLDYIEFEVATVSPMHPSREEVKRILETTGQFTDEFLSDLDSASEERLNKIAIYNGLQLEAGQIALRYINKYEPVFERTIVELIKKRITPPETSYATVYNEIPDSENISFGGIISFPKTTSSPARIKIQQMVDYHLKDIRKNIREELYIFRHKTGLEITWNYPQTKALGKE